MKLFAGTRKAKSSRPEAPVAVDQPSKAVSVEDVVMPDIYGDEFVATVSDVKIPDLPVADTDESSGFNPYDTAVLRKK